MAETDEILMAKLSKEAARLPAPWVNRAMMSITDGGQIRLSFIECDGASNTQIARAAVTMSPSVASLMAELINAYVHRVDSQNDNKPH